MYQYQRIVTGLPHEEAKKAMLETWEPDEIWGAFMALSGKDFVV
jgi:hypothetical protein